jgi:tRNA(Leu) C34 or U34 (ribose-2'-O)-methylase TrmL
MIYARGYFAAGLCLPRDDKNVACALRACGAFDAAFLAYSGKRYQKHAADTQVAWRHMPLILAGDEPADILSALPHACVPVAVEIDARAVPLERYAHPERAFYIFGPEDGSIPEDVITRCADVVRIPSRFCLNLAAAVNVVLYDRAAKRAPNRSLYANGKRLEVKP